MANYYTYGEIPDVEQSFSGGALDFFPEGDGFLNPRLALLAQSPAFSAPATTAPSSGGGSSAPTWYRWSDGTYNRNPESTGIRTPYDQLPDQYKQLDSRRPAAAKEAPPPSPAQPPELVTEPDKGFMRTGPGAPVGGLTPLPEEPPVGPPPVEIGDLIPALEGPSGLGSIPSQRMPEPQPFIPPFLRRANLELFDLPPELLADIYADSIYVPPEGPSGLGSIPSQELPVSKPEISGLAPAPEGPSGLGSRPSQELPVAPPAIAAPSQELNRPQALPTTRPAPEAPVNLFVEGFTPDTGFETGAGDYDAMQKVMASLSLMDPQALKGLSGTSFADPNVAASAQFRADTRAGIGGGGSIYEEGALEAAKAAAADPTKGIFSAGFQQLLAEDPEGTRAAIEAKAARDLGALAQVEADYGVMKPLSDLLKANRFQEAFALAKETGSLDKLMDTNVLRELRPAFSQQEMRDFFAAVPPEYAGGKYDFKPDVGVLESMDPFGTGNLAEAGYPDPTRAFKRKDDKTIENLAKIAAVAMLTAGLAPIATGGGAVGGAGAAGAGAAGAAGGAGALTGVVPTGLVAGTTAANLALPVFTVTAGSGLTAAQLAAAAAGLGGAGALTSGSAAAPTTTTTPTPEPPLEEVVVTGTRPPVIPPAAVVGGLAGTGALVTRPPVVEPPLEEVVVEAKKPVEPEISVPPPIAPPSVPVEPVAPEAPLEEVTVQAKRPTEPPIVVPPVTPTPTSPIDTAFPEAPLEEVVIEAKRPVEPPIVVPPIAPPPTTPIDTAFPEGPVEEVVVETTKPTPEKPIIPPIVIPTTTPVDIPKEPTKINQPENPLKALLDKYGSLENFLKLLGALGSAASGTKGTTAPTGGIGTGGMGGALPKYTYTRTQLSPDIDYYTYGTRPEAKFFDYGVQLEKPTQPELPPAKPPGEEPVMAQGGLMGYAKGGSKESRYFDGPGSGRDDKIPALLSDGEYVMDAETLALLGDGSTKEGARRMDKFRANIRKHKGRALSRGQISPDAKSPEEHMGGGLS